MENIDDECDENDIAFVKIDDDKEAEEWGIDELPTIVKLLHFHINKNTNLTFELCGQFVLRILYSMDETYSVQIHGRYYI